MATDCYECGQPTSFLKRIYMLEPGNLENEISLCGKDCLDIFLQKNASEKSKGQEEFEQKVRERKEKLASIILTTVSSLSNSPKYEELEIITAECVSGMNMFRDMFAAFSDVFGGRSDASQKVLRDLRKTCLEELRSEAYEIGADAVIGVDLDYSEFSGGGKSMLFLVASGTAVKFIDESNEADTATTESDI